MLKNLFQVPDKEKITDIVFSRVLISSVFGILLSMCCLVGTTWAWFVAGVENTENVIAIATVEVEATLYQEDTAIPAAESYALNAGAYTAQLKIHNNATDTNRPVYVQINLTQNNHDTTYYVMFETGITEKTIQLNVDGAPATVVFTALWAQPTVPAVENDTISIMTAVEEVTSPTTTATETTTSTTDTTTTDTTVTTTESTETQSTVATEPTEPIV